MERVPQLPLLMKKKPACIKKELNMVITMKAKKTKRDDDEFNKEKVITKKAKKEKDVVITTKVKSKQELEKDVVITTEVKKKPSRSKKTATPLILANKEKDVVITKKDVVITTKEKDLWSSPCEEEEDETTQHCSYCGASRVQPGAVRCEACGIYN